MRLIRGAEAPELQVEAWATELQALTEERQAYFLLLVWHGFQRLRMSPQSYRLRLRALKLRRILTCWLILLSFIPVSPKGPVNRLPESQMSRLQNEISLLKWISVRNRWCHLCAYFRSDSIGLFLLFYLGAAFRWLLECRVTLLRKLLASLSGLTISFRANTRTAGKAVLS